MNKHNLKAYLAWVNVCVIWGTTYLAIRIGVGKIPPMLFAGIRWLIAGTILFTVLKFQKFKMPSFNDLKHIAVTGILLLGFGNGLVVFGEKWVPSGLTALLITTVPIWVVIIEFFLPHSPGMNWKIITGLLMGFSGVVIIFWNSLSGLFDPSFVLGIICLSFAVITWALGSLYSRYKKLEIHPLMNSSFQMLIVGFLQILLGLVLGEARSLSFELNSFLSLLYLILFGSLIGYTSYIYALAHLPVSFVTTYAYINPIIALILGWLVLGEKLDIVILLSALVIFLGVAIVKSGTNAQLKKISSRNY